jgi:hypothetical protein
MELDRVARVSAEMDMLLNVVGFKLDKNNVALANQWQYLV